MGVMWSSAPWTRTVPPCNRVDGMAMDESRACRTSSFRLRSGFKGRLIVECRAQSVGQIAGYRGGG